LLLMQAGVRSMPGRRYQAITRVFQETQLSGAALSGWALTGQMDATTFWRHDETPRKTLPADSCLKP
jgi:hypothetical protein